MMLHVLQIVGVTSKLVILGSLYKCKEFARATRQRTSKYCVLYSWNLLYQSHSRFVLNETRMRNTMISSCEEPDANRYKLRVHPVCPCFPRFDAFFRMSLDGHIFCKFHYALNGDGVAVLMSYVCFASCMSRYNLSLAIR